MHILVLKPILIEFGVWESNFEYKKGLNICFWIISSLKIQSVFDFNW